MTFETKLQTLIDKQPKGYHLNENVRNLIRDKHEYYGLIKMFSWLRNVAIFVEEHKVTVDTPGEFHMKAIKDRYSGMMQNYYDRPVEIT